MQLEKGTAKGPTIIRYVCHPGYKRGLMERGGGTERGGGGTGVASPQLPGSARLPGAARSEVALHRGAHGAGGRPGGEGLRPGGGHLRGRVGVGGARGLGGGCWRQLDGDSPHGRPVRGASAEGRGGGGGTPLGPSRLRRGGLSVALGEVPLSRPCLLSRPLTGSSLHGFEEHSRGGGARR